MKLRITLTLIIVLSTFTMNAQTNSQTEIVVLQLNENDDFPNNTKLPVLLYRNVFGELVNPEQIESTFHRNSWGGSWRNGIYNFQHYHSTSHEVLGVYGGWAEVQLGGDGNKIMRIEKGDMVVLPAGTAHKRIDSSSDFAVVGAYPDQQKWDMNYGKKEEMVTAIQNISKVALPTTDPFFGKGGNLFEYWK